ncbi:MAG: hypothetical protein LBO05_14050 [Deltaproteobacteria bacterium]|nr:hypothetical protein [Deltaproteobacteria bacterium]
MRASFSRDSISRRALRMAFSASSRSAAASSSFFWRRDGKILATRPPLFFPSPDHLSWAALRSDSLASQSAFLCPASSRRCPRDFS